MATCKYCGQSSGLFSSSHKECEGKHTAGVGELRQMLTRYFQHLTTATDIQHRLQALRKENYLNADDIATEATTAIDNYTAAIHRPFNMDVVQNVVHLVSALAEHCGSREQSKLACSAEMQQCRQRQPYRVIDRNGAVTRFAQKVIKGHIAEYFTGRTDINTARAAINQVTSALPISNDALQEAYLYMLDKAATNYLKDGLLSPQEEQRVSTYTSTFNIPTNNLPANYQGGNIAKMSQASILSNLQRGVLPPQNTFVPIMLGKGETILWQYSDVKLFEEKVQREYHSNRGGLSVRICKGVYYRPSTGRMKPVEHSYMNLEGTGELYITNKHLIFNSPTKGVKIPYSKIIGVTPYSDGLEVNRDGNTKRLILQGFDSWFVMNVLSVSSGE